MKTAVVTLCVGEAFHELAEVTHPTIAAYAKKIGAEFQVIDELTIDNPKGEAYLVSYEKYQLSSYLHHFDRIIYLDTDIIVCPDCPNLFDVVPLLHFGAFSEGKHLDREGALSYGARDWGWSEAMSWRKNYFNAGVMVFDKTHQRIFQLPQILHNNFYDQTWFNFQVGRLCPQRFTDIGLAFNRMPSMHWESRLDSFIIHYAGGPGHRDLSDIRKDIAAWT